MGKVIDFYKKKQNLVLGLLIAAFIVLIFVQTISITEAHPEQTVKDFAITRPVSIPGQGDVKTVLDIFQKEIGDVYSFDYLYNNVYALFILGLVSMVMCFKKFNKGLASKVITLGYGGLALYSLLLTNNLAYILSTYDSTYIAKVVVAVLIILVSLGGIAFIVADLAKNKWLKYVNVHVFLNSICSILMFTGLALMFMPFEFEGKTASIMGYLLLPGNYDSSFALVFEKTIENFNINGVIIIPLLLFVIGILGSIFCIGYHKNAVTPIMAVVWAVLCIVGCIINPLMVLDGKFIIYIVISCGIIAASVLNFINLHKANAIYRQ